MIAKLREQFSLEGLDGYILPSHNQWFLPSNLLKEISGFSGSSGLLIITKKDLIFYTDSRYLLQAKIELPEGTLIFNSHEPSSCEALEQLAGQKLGLDPKLFIEKDLNYYEKFGIIIVEKPLVEEKFTPESQIMQLPIEITGLSSQNKIQLILEEIPDQIEYLVIQDPAALAWLLNIRAQDLPHTPLLLGYAIIDCTSYKVKLFTTSRQKLDGIEVIPLQELESHLNAEATYGLTHNTRWFTNRLSKYLEIKDTTLLLRAKKNPTEIHGIREAQARDTAAFKIFMTWLDEAKKTGELFDELTVVEKIYQARKVDPHFIGESFATIAGYGSSGAIVHYHPNEKSNKICSGEIPILLLDSGGQYDLGGTTDITRVFALGPVPQLVIEIYTDLLKGHLALASAIFPRGTDGAQLEVLARYNLWKRGLNYGHGTGHGVGHFSSVHEGPHGLSKKNHVPLEPGMVVSIEPGYYEEGAFGLRIENLYLVVEAQNHFLKFELLTKVPLDEALIDFTRLTPDEKELLKKYFPSFPDAR